MLPTVQTVASFWEALSDDTREHHIIPKVLHVYSNWGTLHKHCQKEIKRKFHIKCFFWVVFLRFWIKINIKKKWISATSLAIFLGLTFQWMDEWMLQYQMEVFLFSFLSSTSLPSFLTSSKLLSAGGREIERVDRKCAMTQFWIQADSLLYRAVFSNLLACGSCLKEMCTCHWLYAIGPKSWNYPVIYMKKAVLSKENHALYLIMWCWFLQIFLRRLKKCPCFLS